MSVTQEDIEFQSSSTGSSEGGTRAGIPYSNAKGAFFPNVSEAERLEGGEVIRKWFLYNDAPTDALVSPSVWVSQEPTLCTEELGLGFDDADDADPAQGNMTEWDANAVAALVSDGTDTRDAAVYGLDAAGDPVAEIVTLAGTGQVLTTAVFSVVYGVHLESPDPSNTVLVKQGAGGTIRGTIAEDYVSCFLWLTPLDKGAGIRLDDLPPGESYGFWDRITWPPAVAGVRPNISVIGVEEN